MGTLDKATYDIKKHITHEFSVIFDCKRPSCSNLSRAQTLISMSAGPEADSISITDGGHVDEDLDGNGSSAWRSWRQFRVRAILTCEAIMRRSLELYEREVFFFPQACRVCFQAKADGMIPCEKCWNVAYCSEQHR